MVTFDPSIRTVSLAISTKNDQTYEANDLVSVQIFVSEDGSYQLGGSR